MPATSTIHGEHTIGQFFNFFIWIGMGCLCSFLAQARGRSAFGWFLVGLAAPVIGLILVLVLPDERLRHELRVENRRLREQVRMNKTVADRHQRDVERRLALHDEELHLDTTEPVPAIEIEEAPEEAVLAAGAAPPPEEPVVTRPPPIVDDMRWYYARGGRESESIDIVKLRDLWRSGDVNPDTLIWNKHLDSWKTIDSVAGLMKELNA